MSGLPDPYPAVIRLMDVGRPGVINSISRVFLIRVFLLIDLELVWAPDIPEQLACYMAWLIAVVLWSIL